MTDKKYVVPVAMIQAALLKSRELFPNWKLTQTDMDALMSILEAAIRWQSEDRMVPLAGQLKLLCAAYENTSPEYRESVWAVAREWQRIMYLAPEPVVSEAIKDLLCGEEISGDYLLPRTSYNRNIEEAYNRGVASASKEAEAK